MCIRDRFIQPRAETHPGRRALIDDQRRRARHRAEAVSYTHLDVYKRQVAPGALNAVSMSGSSAGNVATLSPSEPATDIKFCSIDNPDCEACQ